MSDTTPYDRPDLYNLLAPRDPAMEAFYLACARERGGRVLDLACGSGRLAIPLAQAGLEVVGGDLSAAMLDRGRHSTGAADVVVDLVQLDMRDFSLDVRFDTILVAANTILHLHKPDDFAGFFHSVRQHLAPGGILAFDCFVPSPALLARPPDRRETIGSLRHPELGLLTVEESARYDPVAQISQLDWYWSRPGEPDFWRNHLRLRQIFPQELPLLLAVNGMELLERFGDFDRSPFVAGSMRQVCLCRPTRSS